MSPFWALSNRVNKQKIFGLDHNYSVFTITPHTQMLMHTHTHRAWNVLPSATIPSHSIFWTGSSELVTWGDGIRPLTHAPTSRGEQPSGGQTSAPSARLMQHAWQRQTGKPPSRDDYYIKEQTSLRAIAACMQSRKEARVNAGMIVEQENSIHRCKGKQIRFLKVV